MTTVQDDIYRELQENGLLEFAAAVGFLPDISCGQSGEPRPSSLPQAYAERQDGAKDGSRTTSPASQQERHQDGNDTTAAVDHAIVAATETLQSSRAKLNQIVSSYNPGSTPLASSTTAAGCSTHRKSARTSVEQSAGRAASSKGLRHFSLKVCEKVESKGRTTYNEVADELVVEMSKADGEFSGSGAQYDEKNIRRRVYDAINVLMAMDLIQKEKKEIIWRGFPDTSAAAVDRLKSEALQRIAEVERKQSYLQELVDQHNSLKQLLQRRREDLNNGRTAMQLPFILVQAKSDATVEVKISEDMLDVQFDFYNSPFQIHDDSYVLKHMALRKERQKQAPATVERESMIAGGASARGRVSPAMPEQSTTSSTRHDHSMAEQLPAAGRQQQQLQQQEASMEPATMAPHYNVPSNYFHPLLSPMYGMTV